MGSAKDRYQVTLTANGEDITVGASSIEKAIMAIKPQFYKTKGVLKVVYNDKKAERMLFIPQMKKLFGGSHLAAYVMGKNLEKLLK